jgi:hypothetical protein
MFGLLFCCDRKKITEIKNKRGRKKKREMKGEKINKLQRDRKRKVMAIINEYLNRNGLELINLDRWSNVSL